MLSPRVNAPGSPGDNLFLVQAIYDNSSHRSGEREDDHSFKSDKRFLDYRHSVYGKKNHENNAQRYTVVEQGSEDEEAYSMANLSLEDALKGIKINEKK